MIIEQEWSIIIADYLALLRVKMNHQRSGMDGLSQIVYNKQEDKIRSEDIRTRTNKHE